LLTFLFRCSLPSTDPVFPWVLADYTSKTLNLDDPTNASGVFRDLTKPVGALNPTRLKMFTERYHSLDEADGMKRFMYGTHYSSSGTVLHYLMRLEPFTTAAVELQDGKFDHSDRLFHSIPATWAGVTSNAADVKELIPEWFYLPEMFTNDAGIDFGTKQHGEKIHDVVLPPWAGSAGEFVRLHRAALESEYVSLNLHHWIDLIFGFKQQGRAALEANNVFFHLTYEGAIDIDSIEDPILRESSLSQIENFGQTPSQLFTYAHPQRCTKQEHTEQEAPSLFQNLREWQKLMGQLNSSNGGGSTSRELSSGGNTTMTRELSEEASRLLLQLYVVEQVTASAATENPLLFLALLPSSDRLITVGLDRVMSLHKFKNAIQEYIPPFLLEIDAKGRQGLGGGGSGGSGSGGGSYSGGGNATWSGSGRDANGGLSSALSFMGGSKSAAGTGKRVGVHFTVGLNILPFFFVLSHDEKYLLSVGHWNNCMHVTHVESGLSIQAISAHKDIVTCVAISEVGDFIVTGSKDTTTIVWQVAEYVIDLLSHPSFTAMGAAGAAAASAAASATAAGDLYLLDTPLHVLYGHDDEVTCVSVSSDLDIVLSGSRDGTIMLHALRSGRYTRTITPPDHGAIRWVGISTQGTVLSYSLLDLMLHAYTINGVHIGSCDTGERLYAIQFSHDGEFLLCGGDRKQLGVYQLHVGGGVNALQCVHRLPPTDSTIRSIVLTDEEQHVLIGTSSGKLHVYGLNADYLRKRFLRRLAHLGI
jgi:WD40 repeat protein